MISRVGEIDRVPGESLNIRNKDENHSNYDCAGIGVFCSAGDKDVIVVNAPDVHVVSLPAPEPTVVCVWDIGLTLAGHPYVMGGRNSPPLDAVCPDGVDRINVQRIAFSPDYAIATSVDLAGFLAILTDGTPQAEVAQPFVLETAEISPRLSCPLFPPVYP